MKKGLVFVGQVVLGVIAANVVGNATEKVVDKVKKAVNEKKEKPRD